MILLVVGCVPICFKYYVPHDHPVQNCNMWIWTQYEPPDDVYPLCVIAWLENGSNLLYLNFNYLEKSGKLSCENLWQEPI